MLQSCVHRCRPASTCKQTVTAWLGLVAQTFRPLPCGSVLARDSGTVRTLRALSLLVHRGPDRPHRQAPTCALTEALGLVNVR